MPAQRREEFYIFLRVKPYPFPGVYGAETPAMRNLYVFAFLLSALFANAQTTGNLYYLSSTTGAACYEIEYFNQHIYAGAGNTLIVYDIAANGTPGNIVYQERLPSTIVDIKFRGNIMYIAVNHAGLYTYDASSAVPQFMDSYQPVSNNEAAYDIAFKGSDTVFVAYKSCMAIFTFSSGNLAFGSTFAPQVAGTYVMGCDVKNNQLAYVTSAFDTTPAANSRTGVHIASAVAPFTQYSFHQQDTADPHDVIFGQNTDLLHVLGGTESWANGNSAGCYYALNVANPNLPSLEYVHWLPNNFFFCIAQPMNGELRNDTLYIACEGAWDVANSIPLAGHIYVYDCTNNNVSFINELYAGLWHFDLALNGNRMYIASEWYGVKTIDISNLMSEADLGNTLTGGWNLSSDLHGNRLAIANEGYGFKYYDFSDPLNPTYMRSKVDTGFCQGISFSSDGSHIFGWYYTDDDFRVHDTSMTFNVTGSVPLVSLADYFDPYVSGNIALADQKLPGLPFATHYLVAMDVSNYSNPVLDTTFLMASDLIYRDMCVSDSFLFVVTTGQIEVYNVNNNYQLVTSTNAPPFQTFECMAFRNDTVYVYVAGLGTNGIRKYYFNGAALTYTSGNTPLGAGKPKFLAVDSFALYASYQEDGLYAYNKNTMAQEGHYRNSMEYYRPTHWGQQQLFCEAGYIFDVEYQGQTSVLTMNSTLTSEASSANRPQIGTLNSFPNPVQKGNELTIANPLWSTQGVCEVYNAQGQIVSRQNVNGQASVKITTSDLESGVYFVTITNGVFDTYTGKFIVE